MNSKKRDWRSLGLLHYQSFWKQVPEHTSEPHAIFYDIVWCMEGYLWNFLWLSVSSNESPYLKCQYLLGERIGRRKKTVFTHSTQALRENHQVMILLFSVPWRALGGSPGFPSSTERCIAEPALKTQQILGTTGWSRRLNNLSCFL